jgi:excisionase family DNA binding protein
MKRKTKRRKTTMAVAPIAIPRKEAARALSLSLSTLDRAIRRGDLKAKKYGTRVLVPNAEIDRYLKQLDEAGATPPDGSE